MLFETSGQRPGSKSSPPPAQPANVAGQSDKGIESVSSTVPKNQTDRRFNVTSAATKLNPRGTIGKIVTSQNTVTPKSSYSAVKPLAQKAFTANTINNNNKKAAVTGWPSQQQGSKGLFVSTTTRPAGTVQKARAVTSSTVQNAQVNGWHSQPRASKKPPVSTTTRLEGVTPKAPVVTSSTQKAPLPAWRSLQQNALKPKFSTVARTIPTQRVYRGTSTISQQKAPVIGWPSQQQSIKQQRPPYKPPYSSRVTPTGKTIKRGSVPQALRQPQRPVTSIAALTNYGRSLTPQRRQQTVTGWQYSGRKVQRPTTTTPVQKRQIYNDTAPSRIGTQVRKNSQYYSSTGNYVTNTTGNIPSKGQTVPLVQTPIVGWPSNRISQSTLQPCNCSQCIGTSQSSFVQTGVPPSAATNRRVHTPVSPKSTVCRTCGSKEKGCTTLSGFAINSALLTPDHKQQLRQLSSSILKKDSNAVVATGYTNSSKTEQLVENLGERRALAVVSELKRQLSKLTPNAQKSIFWKTLSKAVTLQDSMDASGNRRVEICVRQLR